MASGWWKSSHTNLASGGPVDFAVTTSANAPRGYPKLASIATGAGHFLGGTPCVAIDDIIYYAGDGYTQGTDDPILLRYDGRTCTTVLEIPDLAGTPAKAILSLAASTTNDLYISTWDSGTTSSDFAGRVFKHSATDGTLTRIDNSYFTAGKLPYNLVWFNSALYVGVNKQNPTTTTEVAKLTVGTALSGGPTPTPTLTGTSYTYRVIAIDTVDGTGTSMAKSNISTACINRASLNASQYNALTWNHVGQPSYKVERIGTGNIILTTTHLNQRDTGQATIGGATATSEPETITLTVASEPAAATCTYRIGAVINGIEFLSAAGSATGRATLYSDLYMALSWSAVSGASAYRIYRTAGHTSTGLIGTTTSTTFNDTGLVGAGSVPTVGAPIALTAGAVSSMAVYGADLYIGSYQPAATFGKVFKITTSDVLSTSTTEAPGGTAQAYNGFTAMIAFEGNLYAGYWNDDATDITLIKKYTGSAWSTVQTISGAGARPIIGFMEADGKLWAYGGGDGKTGILYSSPDGTTWTDQTALLPTSVEAIPFMANANVLGGF